MGNNNRKIYKIFSCVRPWFFFPFSQALVTSFGTEQNKKENRNDFVKDIHFRKTLRPISSMKKK